MRKFFTLTFVLFTLNKINAQWNIDPTVNNLVTNTSSTTTKNGQVAALDASDNMFVAWEDSRNNATTGTDIYLQKLDDGGNKIFANDILVCNAVNGQSNVNIQADGSGGVIVIWQDNRVNTASGDIYMQRFDANGVPQWTANGLGAITNTENQIVPTTIRLNATEFAIVWRENRTVGTTGIDLYANKFLLSDGSKLWATDLPIVVQNNTQQQQQLITDGTGGFYCVWNDPRTATTSSDIYGIRVNNDGTLATGWNVDGNEIANITGAFNLLNPQLATDNAGGFITTWTDNRAGTTDVNIYAQRLNASGVVQWAANGVALCTAVGNQTTPFLITDGANGAIITWSDNRVSTTDRNVYAQRIDGTGTVQWTADGVAVCTALLNQPNATSSLNIVSDKVGGAVLSWDDNRANNTTTGIDIYAQRISGTGSILWSTANGVAVGTLGTFNQRSPIMVQRNVTTEAAIVVFLDGRTGSANASIYASSLNLLGLLPINYTYINAVLNGHTIAVKWGLANGNEFAKFEIEKSTNGVNFNYLNTVTASTVNDYTVNDVTPYEGFNYYRVKAFHKNGETKYSTIAKVKYSATKLLVAINPNPIIKDFTLALQNATVGNYTLSVYDNQGKLIHQEAIKITTTSYTKNIVMPNIANGNYVLQIKGKEGIIYDGQIIKQ